MAEANVTAAVASEVNIENFVKHCMPPQGVKSSRATEGNIWKGSDAIVVCNGKSTESRTERMTSLRDILPVYTSRT